MLKYIQMLEVLECEARATDRVANGQGGGNLENSQHDGDLSSLKRAEHGNGLFSISIFFLVSNLNIPYFN